MYKGLKVLALITARAGSTGLPGKNIIKLGDKPLITWSVEAGLNSQYVDKVVVSTDGEDIAQVSKEAGADVPFLRPKSLAENTTAIEDVVHHAIDFYRQEFNETFDLVLLMLPTSPFRMAKHIDQAIAQFVDNQKSDSETLVSVQKAPAKMAWLMAEDENGFINFCLEKNRKGLRRQKVPDYYLPNGAIYLASVSGFKDSFYTEQTQHYVMSSNDSIDIDTIDDLKKAQAVLHELTD